MVNNECLAEKTTNKPESEWIEWDGRAPGLRLFPDVYMLVKHRSGTISGGYPRSFQWTWDQGNADQDIVAYQKSDLEALT